MSENGNGSEPIAGTGIFVPLTGVGDYQQGRTYPLTFDRDYNPPAELGGAPETLWRLTLHRRQFDRTSTWTQTLIGEIHYARGRRLEYVLDQATTLTFTLDGQHPMAPQVIELQTDVRAWRWDEKLGHDVCMFRGIVYQAEDELTDSSNVIVFTAKDYIAMLERRVFTGRFDVRNMDQDDIAEFIINQSSSVAASNGHSFYPGSQLPLHAALVNPDGSNRVVKSGFGRDRSYIAGALMSDMFTELSNVIDGFDFDILPSAAPGNTQATDALRIFHDHARILDQGVIRTDMLLNYGSNVAGVTRTVSSSDYSNYWRTVGMVPEGAPEGAAPLYAEAWNDDSAVAPFGLWMGTDNAADVSIQATLNAQAQGNLNQFDVLTPTYSLTMRPGAYTYGNPNMGDIVPLIIKGGRLNVNTTERIVGINIDIGDDGNEDVELIVGRPYETLPKLLKKTNKDVAALTRR
jgi:hypothetical protein